MSRSYSRMAIGGEHCEYFAAASTAAGFAGPGGVKETRGHAGSGPTTCESCHYWLPFGMMPQVGQCDNPSSMHFGNSAFSDKPTEECFVTRSLEDLEFMWCQTHRQTIHATDLSYHRSCGLYVSSVSLPVEDSMELTLAGD